MSAESGLERLTCSIAIKRLRVFTQPGSFPDLDADKREVRFDPTNGHRQRRAVAPQRAISGLMHRTKFVLFATSLPRLSIGCAITD
jgi:hypothetical protein